MPRNRNRTRTLLATGGLLAVLVVGAAVPALAQSETPDATTEDAPADRAPADDASGERNGWFDDLATSLAEKLGVAEEDVTTALEEIREERAAEADAERRELITEQLDAAVEDGDLTQEQADAIADAAESGALPFGRGHGGHGGPGGGFGGHGGLDGPGGFPGGDVREDATTEDGA